MADINRHPELGGGGEVKTVRFSGPPEPGATFEADNAAGEVGSFVSRNVIAAADLPRRLAWTWYPPLDDGETPDHQISGSLVLQPGAGVDRDRANPLLRGAAPEGRRRPARTFIERTDRIATITADMRKTLENVKRIVGLRNGPASVASGWHGVATTAGCPARWVSAIVVC